MASCQILMFRHETGSCFISGMLCPIYTKLHMFDKNPDLKRSNGAFPLHGTVRFGTARYGTVRLSSGRFAFPPQFSTAIEWAGLFTCRYNCAASTAVTSS